MTCKTPNDTVPVRTIQRGGNMNSFDFNFQRLKKPIKYVLLAVVLVILGFGSFFTLSEQEAAVITTFGNASSVTDSGLHFKIPFIQQVTKVDTTIKGFPIGYEELMRLAIDYSDAIILSTPNVNPRLLNYAQTSGKPILPYNGDELDNYADFCNSLLNNAE